MIRLGGHGSDSLRKRCNQQKPYPAKHVQGASPGINESAQQIEFSPEGATEVVWRQRVLPPLRSSGNLCGILTCVPGLTPWAIDCRPYLPDICPAWYHPVAHLSGR